MNFKKVITILFNEFKKNNIDFALIGGHALYFANVVRATVDIDFLLLIEHSEIIDKIMKKYSYDQIYKTENVANYCSPLSEMGNVDFLFAFRKYSKQMLARAQFQSFMDLKVKVIIPEDIIGLKLQSSSNDPLRYHKDMADIEAIILNNKKYLDFQLIREYFKLFDRENELNDFLEKINETI